MPTGCAVWRGDLYFGSFGTGLLYRLPLPPGASPRADVVRAMGAGVTDLEVGPDGDLYVATSDAIWRFTGTARGDGHRRSPRRSVGRRREQPIAIVAGIVLAAGLAARFIAGRRLRRDVSED